MCAWLCVCELYIDVYVGIQVSMCTSKICMINNYMLMTANKYLYSVSLGSLSYSLLVWYLKYLHNIQVCIAEKPKYLARKVELLELMHLYLDQTLNLNQE